MSLLDWALIAVVAVVLLVFEERFFARGRDATLRILLWVVFLLYFVTGGSVEISPQTRKARLVVVHVQLSEFDLLTTPSGLDCRLCTRVAGRV